MVLRIWRGLGLSDVLEFTTNNALSSSRSTTIISATMMILARPTSFYVRFYAIKRLEITPQRSFLWNPSTGKRLIYNCTGYRSKEFVRVKDSSVRNMSYFEIYSPRFYSNPNTLLPAVSLPHDTYIHSSSNMVGSAMLSHVFVTSFIRVLTNLT